MSSLRSLFLSQVGQTNERPIMLEVSHAEGIYIYGSDGKRYIDLNSGIAVSSLGHCHPRVVRAIRDQSTRYMHTMVYGEHIQAPQVEYARLLLSLVDRHFESIYYLMSGTEATELAMKMAKKYTGRYEIIACRNAYHGSTQGAESLRSDEDYKAAYRPLLPGIRHIDFNNEEDFGRITKRTACVICEVIQGEAGVISAGKQYLRGLSDQCREKGVLLIIDEIQSGFGRTGSLFAHQQYDIIPDILLIGKAMGGGMPIAGVVSSNEIMKSISIQPALGHITTFGGHPVSVSAALAALQTILEEKIIESVEHKAAFIADTLTRHPIIKEVRHAGLLMAVETTKKKYLKHIVHASYEKGVLIDWFLFNNRSFRLAPPLIITMEEIKEACAILLEAFDYAEQQYK